MPSSLSPALSSYSTDCRKAIRVATRGTRRGDGCGVHVVSYHPHFQLSGSSFLFESGILRAKVGEEQGKKRLRGRLLIVFLFKGCSTVSHYNSNSASWSFSRSELELFKTFCLFKDTPRDAESLLDVHLDNSSKLLFPFDSRRRLGKDRT